MPVNKIFLGKIKDCIILGDDFLEEKRNLLFNSFDRIIANPPFSKNQDIDHIYKMYQFLTKGGRLVSIASTHWETSSNKKEVAFRDWLTSKNASIRGLSRGAFKESGTEIETRIIIIDK